MNPVCVIATSSRKGITTDNIASLQSQSLAPAIVVVVSDTNEGEYYSRLGVHVVVAPNHPLGKKWSAGVAFARKLMPSHLIITGSDDILAQGFISKVCKEGCDFIGLRQWYVLNDKKLYLFDYLASGSLPLGGGRCYSRKLLDSCNWEIFDSGRDKLLDDLGFEIAWKYGNYKLLNEPLILAVKGNWETLNPFNQHLRSKNVRIIKWWVGSQVQRILKEKFNYGPKVVL